MYQVSDNYKNIIYADSTKHVLEIYINDTQVNPNHIFDFSKSFELFGNDEFVLGSTPAQSIEFKIYKDSLPDHYENIFVKTGIESEKIPLGHFILDSINKENENTVTIKAIDNMVKFEFNYDGSELNYPVTILTVLKDICNKAGIELRFYFFY